MLAASCLPVALFASSLAITSPASGSVLPGATATFTVGAESSVSQYQLWLGTTAGSDNLGLYNSGSTSASSISFTATGLPTSGGTVYATLYWNNNGSWGSSQSAYKEASGSSSSGSSSDSGSLALGSTSVAFGDVDVKSPATQTVTLTSSGTGSVTISGISISGTGFTTSGVSTPMTLSSKQSASLQVQFDPTTTGSFSGTVTISSNASNGSTMKIALSGTGQSASSGHSVDLNWDAPSNSSGVSGYNVYRAPSGSSLYSLLNSSPTSSTSYTDSTAQAGSAYNYEVESVDGSGVESQPSNVFSATIPN
jgi:hypothetical protein